MLAAAVAAQRPYLSLGHLGWDTYPLTLTSRVAGANDLLGVFREELMDGQYPHGRFYRPLTSLTFALDHALFGLAPLGYHLTDLALLLAATLGLAALAQRLLGPGAGPLAAALLFALHPLHVETLPVAARRADTLAQLLTLLALVAAPRAGAQRSLPRAALSGALAGLAVAAKETGVIALPLLFTLHALEAHGATAAWRLRAAARASLLPGAAILLVLLARSAVLGGLGGHPGSSPFAAAGRALELAPLYARLLVMPQPLAADPAVARACFLAGALALAATLLALARERWLRTGLLVSAVWLATGLWLTALSGEVASWYGLALLPAYALLVGAVAAAAQQRLRSGQRAAGALGAGVLGGLLVLALRFTPLVHVYPEWALVSERSQAFLERVREAARGAAAGEIRYVPGIPLGLAQPIERVGVRSAMGLAAYSVEAWGALALPGPALAVVLRDAARPSTPRAERILIETSPDPAAGALP